MAFGSGDSDNFSYDGNTFRMTQFKFNVGTQSQYLNGALTWNPNGSLRQLAITDQFNNADTQTCNYSHDDVSRIATANCGSAANQTFSYDPFGNISKSGSPYAFQPSYSASTNRMTSIAGFTPTYDNNGNVTNDGNHTYSWDADGNSVALDGVGLTFDAFDRMAEQNRSGTHTQIVYAPGGGKLALMSGQTLQKAFVPLPGQAVAVYTSAGLDHYRHSDWLGSARLTSSPTQSTGFLSSVAYAPFGETYASSGTMDSSFTGQNTDTVSTDYDFLHRPYSTQGRWPTPDPAGLVAVDPTNPQSWNRYAYVMNNPLKAIDPTGLYCMWDDGTSDDDPWDGGATRQECIDQGGTWTDKSNPCQGADGCVAYDPGQQPTETVGQNCPINPPAPPASNASVDQNIKTTRAMLTGSSMSGYGQSAAVQWWVNQVKGGGPWDYKVQYPASDRAQNMLNSSFGNFNFGATCNALNLPLSTCQRGAGAVDWKNAAINVLGGGKWTAGPGNPFTGTPASVNGQPDFGDQTNWAENPSVIDGWNYAQAGCHQ